MKLSKAIIKKHGITKKAWSIARQEKGIKTRTSEAKMARRRRFGRRASFRGFARRANRVGGQMSVGRIAIAGILYGAIGRPLVSKVADMTGRPLGSYTDEAIGAVAGYALRNQKGIIGDVAKVAMITEIASASNQLAAPYVSGMLGGTNNNSGNGIVTYG